MYQPLCPFFLNFLGCFPEKHVRSNRRADDARDDEEEREVEFDMRDECRHENRSPRFLHHKYGDDVGEQRDT